MEEEQALDNVARQATDYTIQKASEAAAAQLQEDNKIQSARVAAKELINYAYFLQSREKTLLEQTNSVNYGDSSSLLKFSKNYIETREEYLKLMNLAFEFQNRANEILGNQVKIVYLWKGKNSGQTELYTYENTAERLTTGENFRGRYKLGRENGEKLEQDNPMLDATYLDILRRYGISRNRIRNKANIGLILWYDGGWGGAWTPDKATLGQAYVNYFLNRHQLPSDLELAIEEFMLSDGSHRGNFLSGNTEKNGVSYVVKESGQAALRIKDVIKYAQGFLESQDPELFLQNLKKDLDSKKEKVISPLRGKMKNETTSVLSQMKKTQKIDITI
jgi:hypothetical protein